MKTLIAFALALLATGCSQEVNTMPPFVAPTKYKVGQAWNYRTREGEDKSRIIIVRAEPNEKLGTIYHIHVDGVRIRNPLRAGGVQEVLPHSPVSEKTLDDSVTTLAIGQVSPLPDISEEYATWKEGFDSGQNGIFTIPVSQIIQHMEDIFRLFGEFRGTKSVLVRGATPEACRR